MVQLEERNSSCETLHKGDSDLNESVDFLLQLSTQAAWKREKRFRLFASFWFATTVIFATLSAYLYAQVHFQGRFGSFQSGYRTELGERMHYRHTGERKEHSWRLEPAKHLIEVEEKWFEASPAFLDDGFEYIPEREDGTQRLKYVGEPSKEIDHNWEQLHWGRFFLLSEEEARAAWGPDYTKYWAPREGGYVAALEVMHTVHCLVSARSEKRSVISPSNATKDHIRQAFWPEIYPIKNPIHGAKHRDHCIEHLRQMTLCNADLTPIPSIYFIGVEDNYINSDRPHTCRNFQKIRDWVSERFNGTSRVAPYPGTVWSDEWINTDRPHTKK
ncbi:Putative mycotoxin biosynthesis protein UstYa [Colletotrichum destructivum]|uniref:Mycotoxin biosynthesis protein UstYa n=1 Tax=Colletotrichum destructivum TaxID=34406 RepID=A0AAX4IHM4_9PEZI|nr:Putative mycotoxin biosynthesis protein UstYa [Colletotrichum destructivum]